MKRSSKSLLAAAVVGGLTFGTVGIVRAAHPSAAAEANTVSSKVIPMAEHDWPKLRRALDDLRNARAELDDIEAEPRFHEHRARAVEHADAAIHECEACLDEVGAHHEH